MVTIIYTEDFLQNAAIDKTKAEKIVDKFNSSYLKISENLIDEAGDPRKMNHAHLSVLLSSIVRETFYSKKLKNNKIAANTERKRISRERKLSKLKLPETNGKKGKRGKSVTIVTQQIGELIYWLMYGNGSGFSKKKLLLQKDAIQIVAKWLLLLKVEKGYAPEYSSTGTARAIFEEKVENLAVKLKRSFSDWHPQQVPRLPKGFGISSGRKAQNCLVKVSSRKSP